MPCVHKFLNHAHHLPEENGLLPSWRVKAIIIGTFNPSNEWAANNLAQYFYGRSEYFWRILPRFFSPTVPDPAIQNVDINRQIDFLTIHNIGLTDLLVSVNDADINNQDHVRKIASYKDEDLETFTDFTWNTDRIISHIERHEIVSVFFTRKGNPRVTTPRPNSFEAQMRRIETYCDNNNVRNHRLHTPTGLGLGKGVPRENKLTHKWFFEGAYDFPSRLATFQLTDYPWAITYNSIDDYF